MVAGMPKWGAASEILPSVTVANRDSKRTANPGTTSGK
jgi:hypothetical protein